MRGDINFKGSDSSDLSVYFLFCVVTIEQIGLGALEIKESDRKMIYSCDLEKLFLSCGQVTGLSYR